MSKQSNCVYFLLILVLLPTIGYAQLSLYTPKSGSWTGGIDARIRASGSSQETDIMGYLEHATPRVKYAFGAGQASGVEFEIGEEPKTIFLFHGERTTFHALDKKYALFWTAAFRGLIASDLPGLPLVYSFGIGLLTRMNIGEQRMLKPYAHLAYANGRILLATTYTAEEGYSTTRNRLIGVSVLHRIHLDTGTELEISPRFSVIANVQLGVYGALGTEFRVGINFH